MLLIQDTLTNVEGIAKSLITKGKIIEIDNNYISKKYCTKLLDDLKKSVENYQNSYKSEAGMPLENANISRSLVNLAVENGILTLENNKLHTPDFVPENDEIFNTQKAILKDICIKAKWQLLTIDELKKEMNIPEKSFIKLVQAMKNSNELVLVPGNYVLISEIANEMRDILKKLGNKVTLAQVRDATGSTRKFILSILEYFDSKGYTRRAGDYRVVL